MIFSRSFHKMVITETRRVNTTWIIDGELTDRSALSDELAYFCTNYPIYNVKKTPDSLTTTRMETEGEEIEILYLKRISRISTFKKGRARKYRL